MRYRKRGIEKTPMNVLMLNGQNEEINSSQKTNQEENIRRALRDYYAKK